MALLEKEVGVREGGWASQKSQPDGQPMTVLWQAETLATSLTQKGLNLGRKIMNDEVVYLFQPELNFSKQKARQCSEKTVGQRWQT